MKQKASAGDGNVTVIDVGEKFDAVIMDEARKLAGSGLGKSKGKSKSKSTPGSRYTSGYRPGMYGGYKPWYANRLKGGEWKMGALMRLPMGIKEKSKELFTGALIGTAGNRVIAWVAPGILRTNSALAVDGVAFGVTLLPYIVKQNVTTFGIALPGLIYFLGTLIEYGIGAANLMGPKPVLSGPKPKRQQMGHRDAVLAARQKLAEAQRRMQRSPAPQQVPVQPQAAPRVQAQRVA